MYALPSYSLTRMIVLYFLHYVGLADGLDDRAKLERAHRRARKEWSEEKMVSRRDHLSYGSQQQRTMCKGKKSSISLPSVVPSLLTETS